MQNAIRQLFYLVDAYNIRSATSTFSNERTFSIWFAIIAEAEPANNSPTAVFSCTVTTSEQGQTHKTFKVQIKEDLRIYGTPVTPKGSFQWKNDFNRRTSVERVFSDNKRVRQVHHF